MRVDEANRLRARRPAGKLVKSSRWLLLRNRENIDGREDRVKLDELLAANRRLFDRLRAQGRPQAPLGLPPWRHARRFWQQWYRRAIRSRIEPLKKLRPQAQGLPVRHPGPLPLAAAHQPVGRHQQQDQGHQTHGLRLPRRRLLLPQNPRLSPEFGEEPFSMASCYRVGVGSRCPAFISGSDGAWRGGRCRRSGRWPEHSMENCRWFPFHPQAS